jgi:hypothetical protein
MTDASDKNVRIFSVETRFQELARRPGGVPREKAIEQAQARIDEAKPGFDDWLNPTLESLADVIKQAQAGTAQADWIETANRHSRHLRDVGTTMDFELLTFIANSLCEVLDAMAAGSEYNMESVQCHIDALFLSRQRRYRGVKPEQVPELTSGLRRVVEQVSTSLP